MQDKQKVVKIINEAEIEANFACKVVYLKLRNDMTRME